MAGRIRIKDIAQRAGVSKGTVDRVLHKRGNVSKETRKRVLKAVEELGYQPNVIASALAYNRTWRVAALLPIPEEDPFWQQPKIGIDRALKAVRDYGLTIDFHNFREADTQHFQECAQKALQGNYDAVLIAPIYSKEAKKFMTKCEEIGLLYVQINTYLETNHPNFLCYIGQDSYQSGVLAAKLLNFGLAPGEAAMILHLEKEVYNSMHLVEKEKGFEDFFTHSSKKDLQVIKAAFENIHDKVAFKAFIQQIIKAHPNIKGIFVTTSRSFHLVKVLDDLGLHDIKLVGFDLIEENLRYLKEDKIHFLINQNPIKQGYMAVINIFNKLVRKTNPKHSQFLPLDVVMQENLQYYLEDEEEKLHLIF